MSNYSVNVNVEELPYGLTKEELIKRPELQKIRSWFNWAAIVEIGSGLLEIVETGINVGNGTYDQYTATIALVLAIVFGTIDITLGILLLSTKSIKAAYTVGIYGIISSIIAIIGDGSVGGGIAAIVLALLGARKVDKIWKEYHSLYTERDLYEDKSGAYRNQLNFKNVENGRNNHGHRNMDYVYRRPANSYKNDSQEGGLIITRISGPDGIDIIPSKTGRKNPVFFQGVFTFCPTCAVAVGFYPETHELGSQPFFIDFEQKNVKEPGHEWIQYFINELSNNIASNGQYNVPMRIYIYRNGNHPAIPRT